MESGVQRSVSGVVVLSDTATESKNVSIMDYNFLEEENQLKMKRRRKTREVVNSDKSSSEHENLFLFTNLCLKKIKFDLIQAFLAFMRS